MVHISINEKKVIEFILTVPVHGEELPFDELVKPRRSSEKSLGQKEGGWAISRPFAIAIRVARLYTAWLRYRS